MKKKLLSALLPGLVFILNDQPAYSQEKLALSRVQPLADSSYRVKDYPKASVYYGDLAERSDFKRGKAGAFYNMACCLSLQGKTDSAMLILNKAIQLGYANKANMLEDADLQNLRKLPQWNTMVASIKESKKVLNDDPAKARFVTSDIHHFWDAYDAARKDTLHFKEIMKKLYFDRASTGMEDYMAAKVSSIDFFIAHIRSAPKFYAAIRKNTLMTDTYKPRFLESFKKMKSIYSDAEFPDVYFLIGAFTSGGTATDAGLLLGINQASGDRHIPREELSFRLRTRLLPVEVIPNLLGHELVHYQQDGMKSDTTTLSYAIKEGMADMIGELISGSTANPVLFDWAKGKEKQIWSRFTKDMYENRYDNWIANSRQATPDNLPDQGYWIGYQICRSYYEQSADKKQAIYDMLHIQDYKAFLEKSKWEEKLAKL